MPKIFRYLPFITKRALKKELDEWIYILSKKAKEVKAAEEAGKVIDSSLYFKYDEYIGGIMALRGFQQYVMSEKTD